MNNKTEALELKFGKRIRTIRENADYTQKEFCELLDIPQSTLSAYETDKMQPTVATLINISKTFNVSMDWLCGICHKTIGQRIEEERRAHQLTQDEFAKALGKSLRTIQKYESGDIDAPLSVLYEIAEVFGISIAELFEDEPRTTSLPRVITVKGKYFTAEIPTDISPDRLTAFLDKIEKYK